MDTSTPFDLDGVLTRHGLKREDLVKVLGSSMTTVRLWVRGLRKPSIEHCEKAERLLQISKAELRPDLAYLWAPPPERRRRAA